VKRIKKRIKRKTKSLILKLFEGLRIRESFYTGLMILLAITFTLQYASWRADKSTAKHVDAKTPLKEDQVARLIVDLLRDQLIIQQKDKETKVYTGIRKATFTELKDGKIDMDIPTKGLTFEPGLVIGAADGLRLGGDVQYAYWKRWGLTGGITTSAMRRDLASIRGHLGIVYSPHWRWMPGTGFWGGVDTNIDPVFGVRTRF